MAILMDVNIVSIPLYAADWDGTGVELAVLQAPSAGAGGGVRIIRAQVVNGTATAGTNSFKVQLINKGTSGATIKSTGGSASDILGGSADLWVAGTAKEFDLDYPALAADEWLFLHKTEDGNSDPLRGTLIVEYIMGN